MRQDLKISEISPYSVDNLSAFTNNSIYVPVVINGVNYKFNLSTIVTLLTGNSYRSALISDVIALINAQGGTSPSGGNSPSGDITPSGDTTLLELDVNNLKSRVATLESVSTWPLTVITLKNGNRSVDYTIPTNPGGRGYDKGAIVIETSSATVPNFYITINIGTPEVLGTTAYVNATVTVTNQHDGLNLLGGAVGTVALSGSLVMSDGSVHTLSGSKSSSSTLVGGETSSDTETVYFTSLDRLTATVTSGTTVSKVTLSCTISGVSVSGSAERVGTTAIDGSGYIILPLS